ncbi:MAG: VWA domain-containing protein [Saprospiraceae bacterium]
MRLLFLLLFAPLLFAFNPTPPTDEGTANVFEGKIHDAFDRPLENIQLIYQGREIARTDKKGEYRFEAEPLTLEVSVAAPCFLSKTIRLTAGLRETIKLETSSFFPNKPLQSGNFFGARVEKIFNLERGKVRITEIGTGEEIGLSEANDFVLFRPQTELRLVLIRPDLLPDTLTLTANKPVVLSPTPRALTLTPNKTDELIEEKAPDFRDALMDEVIVTGYDASAGAPPPASEIIIRGELKGRESARALPRRSVDGLAATAAGMSSASSPAAVVRAESLASVTKSTVSAVKTIPATTDPAAAEVTERPAAGQLTAGETNDFGKWDLWQDVRDEDLARHRSTWGLLPKQRYAVQLTFADGTPAVDRPVRLTADGATHFETRTDNFGRAELWYDLAGRSGEQDRTPQLQISYTDGERTAAVQPALPFREGVNHFVVSGPCDDRAAGVDIVFAVDATGSMGDEIKYLQSELADIIRRVTDSLDSRQAPRFGSVFYRDKGDVYLTRLSPLDDRPATVLDFIAKQRAEGGGDTPEGVDAALAAALDRMSWREDAAARLLFLVLDASPHQDSATVARMQVLAATAAARGVRIIPLSCSGVDKSTEYLMRSLALATNGTYTFLTNHSGIGNAHIEPSTDSYEVEKLNDLLVRLITRYGRTRACGQSPVPVALQVPGLEKASFTVFPNPTSGPVSIKLPNKEKDAHCSLFDQNGKLLLRRQLGTGTTPWDVGNFPAGSYVMRVEYADERVESLVVVVR